MPAESRQEREAIRNKKKLNTQDDGKGKKAFTRHSADQFDDRKAAGNKAAGNKPGQNNSGQGKPSQNKSGPGKPGQDKSGQAGKRPAKKNAWGTTPKHQR